MWLITFIVHYFSIDNSLMYFFCNFIFLIITSLHLCVKLCVFMCFLLVAGMGGKSHDATSFKLKIIGESENSVEKCFFSPVKLVGTLE